MLVRIKLQRYPRHTSLTCTAARVAILRSKSKEKHLRWLEALREPRVRVVRANTERQGIFLPFELRDPAAMTLSVDREARNVETLIKRISGNGNGTISRIQFSKYLLLSLQLWNLFFPRKSPWSRLVIEFRRLIQIAGLVDEHPFDTSGKLRFNGFKGTRIRSTWSKA